MTSSLALRENRPPPSLASPSRFPRNLRSQAKAPKAARERLIIVGNGMVGHRLCERLVELEATSRYEITVFGAEATPAYDRVHLADVLRGRPAEQLLLRNCDWYEQHGIELRLGERITELDREARLVFTESEHCYAYDKLVFATGSYASTPKFPLSSDVEVLLYRTLDDVQRILRAVEATAHGTRSVVIIGAGLLGLEAARTLQQLGCKVTLLEASSQVLPRQLDPVAAEDLATLLGTAGLELCLKARIENVSRTPPGMRVELAGMPAIEASVIVAAAGVRACDDVARNAGLRCHVRGGIEVDSRLRSSDPQIFAVGECASHAGVPHGLVAPGYAMADALADGLMNRRRKLGPQHAVTRLKLDLIEVNVLGNPLEASPDRDVVFRSPGKYRRVLVKNQRVVGVISLGEWEELPTLQRFVSEARRLERGSVERFEREGELGLRRGSSLILEWPAQAVVCQCANVTCGVLRKAVANGHNTPEALTLATSAGSLCGSCRPLLGTLCGAETAALPPPAKSRKLVTAGAFALVLAVITLLAPRIPFPASLQRFSVHMLWIDSFWKQVSGFSILGIVVIGLLLSLRKRVKRFKFGSYSAWRIAHAVLGALALVALALHTGFRLGYNLNFALSAVFLVSALSGALSGLVPDMVGSNPRTLSVPRLARVTHDVSFWALPALLTFHILKVYYY